MRLTGTETGASRQRRLAARAPAALFVGLARLCLALAPASSPAAGGAEGPWEQTDKVQGLDTRPADHLGSALAVFGDTAFVGAPQHDATGSDSGSVYVFERSRGGWAQHVEVAAGDAAEHKRFGYAVAVSGDATLIGAIGDDDNGENSGSAYVFVRSDGLWVQQAKLTPSDGAEADWFGISVALSGDTALVGTVGDDERGAFVGSAYVFVRTDGVWIEQEKLLGSTTIEFDRFGMSVALSGDVAVVGAPGLSSPGDRLGSAHVFVRSGGIWTEEAVLLSDAADGGVTDFFGSDVSLSGSTTLVGALLDDDLGEIAGAAYVFVKRAGEWTEQAKLHASDGGAYSQFGSAVALSGDTAVIGASIHPDNGGRGAAYVFVRSGGVWTERAQLLANDGVLHDRFGQAVALSDGTVLASAPRDEDAGADSGSVYFFEPRGFDGRIFADGFESGDTSAWASTVP